MPRVRAPRGAVAACAAVVAVVAVVGTGVGTPPPAEARAAAGATRARPFDAAARWERLGAPAGVEPASALAFDAATGRLAVGGERGVALGPLGGRLERVFTRGPVRDLAFAPGGALLAATGAGLFRIDGPARAAALPVAPGEAARSVHDLAVGAGLVAVASDAGVHHAAPGTGWVRWRRATGLPFGPASRVAVEADGQGAVLWAVTRGALWRWQVGETDGAHRVPLPRAVEGEGGVVDLVTGVAGAGVVVLAADGVAVRDRATGRWRHEDLVLPPGAVPRRMGASGGAWWIATDAGLVVATSPAGPWRRAGPPAGHVAVSAVAAEDGRWVVATAHGLLRAAAPAPAARPPAEPPPPRAPLPRGGAAPADPPVQEVQRMALRYLDLEPARMRALRRGAARRAWLPELSLSGGWQRGRDWGVDHDEAFTSGALRRLRDRDRGSDEDFDVDVSLSWDLADLAFTDDSIDVSREARLVAQLRDDVLDEITQLYFERQRVIARLGRPDAEASPAALRLRAAELASGLDAWTGGWFSARASALRDSGPGLPAEEPTP